MRGLMVFCSKCGAKIRESSMVCPRCGVKNKHYRPAMPPSVPPAEAPDKDDVYVLFEPPAPAPAPAKAPPAKAPVRVSAVPKSPLEGQKKRRKQKGYARIGLIAGIATVVALALILIANFGGYKSAISNIYAYYNSYSVSDFKKVIHDDAVQYFAQEYFGGDEAALWSQVEKSLSENRTWNVEYSYEIASARELPNLEVNKFRDSREDSFQRCGMSVDKVTEAYEIETVITTSLEGNLYTSSETVTVFRYDGRWYTTGTLSLLYDLLI